MAYMKIPIYDKMVIKKLEYCQFYFFSFKEVNFYNFCQKSTPLKESQKNLYADIK